MSKMQIANKGSTNFNDQQSLNIGYNPHTKNNPFPYQGEEVNESKEFEFLVEIDEKDIVLENKENYFDNN